MPKLKKNVNGKVLIVIVPDRAGLARETLKSILRQANMTREEFTFLCFSDDLLRGIRGGWKNLVQNWTLCVSESFLDTGCWIRCFRWLLL